MITIHGSSVSPFVRKTLVSLTEKGVQFELNGISPFPPPPEHLKISPLGKIPAMTDGDFSVSDSSAICAYIEVKHPKPALYAADPAGAAKARWYEHWADNELVKGAASVFFHRVAVRMMKREPDQAAIANILTKIQPPLLAYLDAELAGKTWLVNDEFGIADIAVACQLTQLLYAKGEVDAASYPKVADFLSRAMARPSFSHWLKQDGFLKLD